MHKQKTAEKNGTPSQTNGSESVDALMLPSVTLVEGYSAEMCQAYGITILPTDARSPWQNGRTERTGGIWKHTTRLAQRRCPPVDHAEHETLGKQWPHWDREWDRVHPPAHTSIIFSAKSSLPLLLCTTIIGSSLALSLSHVADDGGTKE